MDESRLLALLEHYIERALSDAERTELEDLLRASPQARRTFWEYLEQHAGIWELRQEERGVKGSGAAEASQSISTRKIRRSFRGHRLPRSFGPGVAIAVAASLLLGVLVLRLAPSRPGSSPPKDREEVRAPVEKEAEGVQKRQEAAAQARTERERLEK